MKANKPAYAAARPRDARAVGVLCLVATTVGWGLNWPAMKLILRDWPPLFARGLAGLIASGFLFAIARRLGERVSLPSDHRAAVLRSALFNVVALMGLSSVALLWLRVSEGTLLLYTMPIWAMLFSWILIGSRPTSRGVIGLCLGFLGIMVLLSDASFSLVQSKLPGVLLVLSAAVLFAFGTVTAGRAVNMPPVAFTAWQVALGSIPMVAYGLAVEQPAFGALRPVGWVCMIYMTLIPMGMCYLSWFAALRRLPPSVASVGTLIVPVVGSISAAMMLGEPLGVRQGLALFVTLSGVALALR